MVDSCVGLNVGGKVGILVGMILYGRDVGAKFGIRVGSEEVPWLGP
eukprot:CAMPEP_0183323466 /NCGR_PEP_ID=MMETSP0160_2-20130417/74443_1 /TAXON_ID=2839 ORGANISM="Odontella Sinensis, Strain Grunow 1884" /NCGR_SAMPLE_ID=MMETSP0160_2 /ASSEMBLY_ACC=CAM_ASM_000250 /LENGTH=45 /DNA_ID= /DNA_START= /DNA_END= /DNA_ORIENTATION=